ncbi:MAG: type II CAAX endopeptidase family protein [Armatimonadota bacterium]
MTLFEMFGKLAAYLICVGFALEITHRAYWNINKSLQAKEMSTITRTFLSSFVAIIPLCSALAITYVFIHLIDHKSLEYLGLKYDINSTTLLSIGAGIGLFCLVIIYLAGLSLGYIKSRRSMLSNDCISCFPLFLGGIIDFFTAAVFEEIIFRGYILSLLNEYVGIEIGVFGSSLIFAIAHKLRQKDTNGIFIFNAFVFGVLLAMCRLHTGSLWLPIGLHFGWNVASGPLLGLPFSGESYDKGIVESEVSGPEWLTGGMYSFDSGYFGTVALAIASAAIFSTVSFL